MKKTTLKSGTLAKLQKFLDLPTGPKPAQISNSVSYDSSLLDLHTITLLNSETLPCFIVQALCLQWQKRDISVNRVRFFLGMQPEKPALRYFKYERQIRYACMHWRFFKFQLRFE